MLVFCCLDSLTRTHQIVILQECSAVQVKIKNRGESSMKKYILYIKTYKEHLFKKKGVFWSCKSSHTDQKIIGSNNLMEKAGNVRKKRSRTSFLSLHPSPPHPHFPEMSISFVTQSASGKIEHFNLTIC